MLIFLHTKGIGFSHYGREVKFHYIANNSAIFIPLSYYFPGEHELRNLECVSGTTSNSPEQLLFIVPDQYEDVFNKTLHYEPGLWKFQCYGSIPYFIPSFSGGVFKCRMPDESGAVVETSVGIYPDNYDKNSELIIYIFVLQI